MHLGKGDWDAKLETDEESLLNVRDAENDGKYDPMMEQDADET